MTDDVDTQRYPFNQTPLATVLQALADAINKRKSDRSYWENASGSETDYASIVAMIDDEIGHYEKMMNDLNGRVYVIATPPTPDVTPLPLMPPYNGDPADGTAPSHRDW